jgi:Tol biopolymer transport system component
LEGIAANPKFTPDGKRLCYAMVKEMATPFSPQPGEVWVADVESGRSVSLAPGFQASDYDVSADGQQIVMDAKDPEGRRRLWLVPLDGHLPVLRQYSDRPPTRFIQQTLPRIRSADGYRSDDARTDRGR